MDIPSKQKMVINAMHQTKYLKWKIPIDNPWRIIHTKMSRLRGSYSFEDSMYI